jgi:hypothetical protein
MGRGAVGVIIDAPDPEVNGGTTLANQDDPAGAKLPFKNLFRHAVFGEAGGCVRSDNDSKFGPQGQLT